MRLDKNRILLAANKKYAELKGTRFAGELAPELRSDQVKALLWALVDAINEAA